MPAKATPSARAREAGRYRTIVADPPWTFSKPAATKANARRYYDTMALHDLCGMPVEALAEDDAHLWLWAVNGLMEEAYRVVRAWGFFPTTLLTWCKTQPGVGYYLRNNTEHCIFATRGRPMVPERKVLASWFKAPRGKHSAKPSEFAEIVQQVSPGPYLELFARRAREGWDCWGDEAPNPIEWAA